MFKELKFDAEVGAIRRHDKYDKEWDAVHQFNGSEHKNMVLEYDSEREAIYASAFLHRMFERENISATAGIFRKTNVIVTKLEKAVK